MEKIIRDELEKNRNIKVLDTDTFDFRCTCCGACCRNREDILLSAYDVMRIQKHLGISFIELLEKYCELYVGRPSGLPIIRIRPRGEKKICPFLVRNKCEIHEVKPTVCALYPVGRVTKLNKDSGIGEVVYFVQETDCGAKDVRNNLQEWVRNRITEYDEKCGVLWGEMLRIVHSCISGLEGQISDDTYSYLAQIMYCGYEAVEDFAVEITSRIEQIKTLAEIINGNHTEEEAGNGVVEP